MYKSKSSSEIIKSRAKQKGKGTLRKLFRFMIIAVIVALVVMIAGIVGIYVYLGEDF